MAPCSIAGRAPHGNFDGLLRTALHHLSGPGVSKSSGNPPVSTSQKVKAVPCNPPPTQNISKPGFLLRFFGGPQTGFIKGFEDWVPGAQNPAKAVLVRSSRDMLLFMDPFRQVPGAVRPQVVDVLKKEQVEGVQTAPGRKTSVLMEKDFSSVP